MDYCVSKKQQEILAANGFVRVTGLFVFRMPTGIISAIILGFIRGCRFGWGRVWQSVNKTKPKKPSGSSVIGETCCRYRDVLVIKRGWVGVFAPGGDVWMRLPQPFDDSLGQTELEQRIFNPAFQAMNAQPEVSIDGEIPFLDWMLCFKQDFDRRAADPFCEPTRE